MRPLNSMYHANIAGDFSRSSCSLNRCNLPPRIIGSEEFQANPQPLEIDGARAVNPGLFKRLDAMEDQEERSDFFHEYLRSQFSLDERIVRNGKARPAYSYIHLMRAWGADSNGQAGALLKSWVETRFGLLATFHKGRLADDADSRMAFMQDRTRGSARFIGVLMQMDLLYTFCQDELRKRYPRERWKTLYRGTHDSEEYAIRARDSLDGSSGNNSMLIQLNNLSSFTSDPEVAWEFGSSAWEVKVPVSKIVFFSGLLPRSVLAGENEYLVLGGFYNVRGMAF